MRLKIIGGNLAVVVLLGVAAYLVVSGQLRTELLERVDAKIGSDRTLFERSFRLSALEFVDLVTTRAADRQMRDVFAGLDVKSRRTRAYEAAETTAGWIADPARGVRGGPDIVVIVDETGKALARNGARNVMYGQALLGQIPALAKAFETGQPVHDVWLEGQENETLQTAIAPIRAETGAILGALIVGYDLSNGVAQREGDVLGRDIAFLVEGKVYSSALDGAGARDLTACVFGPEANTTNGVLGGQAAASRMWRATLDGADYSGITAPLPMTPSHPVAFVVLGNRSAQVAALSVVDFILLLTVLGAVLVVLYGFIMGNAIMRPIEAIEEGVLAVINGRTDLRLETESAELGGLAFRINQLLNVFTGTAEDNTDSTGRISVPPSSNDWKGAAFSDSVDTGARGGGTAANPDEPIADPALAQRLASEEQGAYEKRVFDEYVAAKQAAGENVSNIPQDRFIQRLSGRASALAQKHGCRMVRFQVETSGGQVNLRPVLIR